MWNLNKIFKKKEDEKMKWTQIVRQKSLTIWVHFITTFFFNFVLFYNKALSANLKKFISTLFSVYHKIFPFIYKVLIMYSN